MTFEDLLKAYENQELEEEIKNFWKKNPILENSDYTTILNRAILEGHAPIANALIDIVEEHVKQKIINEALHILFKHDVLNNGHLEIIQKISHLGKQFEYSLYYGLGKAIKKAGQNQDWDIAEKLIKLSHNAEDLVDQLLKAAEEDEWDIVEKIIKLGVDKKYLFDELCKAIVEQNEKIVEKIITLNEDKAEVIKQSEIIKKLLELGAYPLEKAVEKREWNVVDLLLKMGANKYEFLSPFVNAAENEEWEIVNKLINLGANPSDLWKALETAAIKHEWEKVEKLINLGAKAHGLNKALNISAENEAWDIVDKLIELGAKPFDIDEILHKAAENHKWEMVDNLIKRGVDKSALLKPLPLAAIDHEWKIVEKIIELGVDKSNLNDIFLHFSKTGDLEGVNGLIKMGFKASAIRTPEGETPHILAEKGNHQIVAERLKHSELRTEATHLLGLLDKIYQGYSTSEGIKVFTEKLNRYQVVNAKFEKPFLEIKHAFKNITESFKERFIQNNILKKSLYSDYLNQKMIVMPSGWPKHFIAIAAIKIGDQFFLLVANRGQGMEKDHGGIIYQLKQDLTESSIALFIERASMQSVQSEIQKIVQPEPFYIFSLKGQKYGTCNIANLKSLMLMLFTFLNFLSGEKNITASSFKQWMEKNKDPAIIEYKKFSYTLRNETLMELLSSLHTSQVEPDLILDALSQFCNQHFPNATVEKQSEFILLYRLANGIPDKYFDQFIQKINPKQKDLFLKIKANPFLVAIDNKHIELMNEILQDVTINPFVEYQGQSVFDVITTLPRLIQQSLEIDDNTYKKIPHQNKEQFFPLEKIRLFYTYQTANMRKLTLESFEYLENQCYTILRDSELSQSELGSLEKELEVIAHHLKKQWEKLENLKPPSPSLETPYIEKWSLKFNEIFNECKKEFESNLVSFKKLIKEAKIVAPMKSSSHAEKRHFYLISTLLKPSDIINKETKALQIKFDKKK